MYLSKLSLDPRSKEARRDVANPYDMHATLCRAFAPTHTDTDTRILWRLEEAPNGFPIVLVQSMGEAQWHVLSRSDAFEGYFLESPRQGVLPLEHLQLGQTLRFRLKANPTVTRDGKRIGLYKPCDLLGYENREDEWVPGWLGRQANKGGFELLQVDLGATERLRFFKHKGGNPITLQSALFDGHLKVTDLEQFKRTLEGGIGKAKGLGFGLLSVAKG